MRLSLRFAQALFLGVVLLGVGLVSYSPPAPLPPPPPIVRIMQVAPSGINLSVIKNASNVWRMHMDGEKGSAFPVASEFDEGYWRTLFISAGHCWEEDTRSYSFESASGRVEDAIFLMRHDDFDIGLWESRSEKPIEVMKLRMEFPEFGEVLYTAGWPLGRHLAITSGFQAGAVGWMSAYIVPGTSGGPVFDHKGAVVGVATAVATVWMNGEPHMAPQVSRYTPLVLTKGWLNEFIGTYKPAVK